MLLEVSLGQTQPSYPNDSGDSKEHGPQPRGKKFYLEAALAPSKNWGLVALVAEGTGVTSLQTIAHEVEGRSLTLQNCISHVRLCQEADVLQIFEGCLDAALLLARPMRRQVKSELSKSWIWMDLGNSKSINTVNVAI